MSDVMDTVKNDMIVTVKNDVMKIILLMVILWSTYMLQLVDAKVYKDSLDQPWNPSPESPGGLPESHSEPLEDPKIVSTGPEIVKDEHDINENPEIASKGFEHDKIDTSFPEGPDVIIPTHDDASKYSNMESEDTEVVSEGPKEVAEEPEDITISPGNTEDVTDKASSNPEFIPDDGSSSSEDPIVVPGDDRPSEGPEEVSDVVVVALGGGEDLVVVAQIASLLNSQGHSVAAIVYGSPHRDEIFPPGVKVLQIVAAEDDPMYHKGEAVGVTPGEDAGVEWVNGRVVASRIWACKEMTSKAWVGRVMSHAKLVVTPLFLHDMCVLGLAQRAGVKVVGVVTSRVGAWWVWEHMGVLPSLASTPVPPHHMTDTSIWARASNLASHYGYLSSLRQLWLAPVLTTLPADWSPVPALDALYASLASVVLVWDPLLDAHAPHTPTVVPVGGFAFQTGHMTKDVLVPALLNRAGVVTVCPGGGEAWLGHDALHALYTALATTSYTVLWRAPYPHLLPNVTQDEGSNTASRPKFVFKETLPLTDVMNHPRHRLLISTCGETDTMAAVYFASPVLCLPVTADQTLAAAALQDLGIGTVVAAGEVTVTTLREALSKLAADRSYREKGRELAEELHDQPLSPADRLLFTLERVMRRPHSRRYMKKGSHLYLLQQSNADVYLLLLILLSSVTALLILLAIMVIPVLLKKQKIKEE